LRHEAIERAELSIVFVTDARIKSLNEKYLNQNNPTDVLAFNFLTSKKNARQISGEIVISVDTAVKHAQIYHTTPYREMLLYVVHGILHLLGYDDHRDSGIRKMRCKEQALMHLISK